MKDRWMNVGHEEEELKPYTEPEPDFNDTKRIGEDFEKNVASGEHRQFYLGRQTKTYKFYLQSHHTSKMHSFYLDEKFHYNGLLITAVVTSLS